MKWRVLLAFVLSSMSQSVFADGSSRINDTSRMQVRWQDSIRNESVISRVTYRGIGKEQSISWTAELTLEYNAEKKTEIAVLPASLTLSEMNLDGQAVAVSIDRDSKYFTVPVSSKGSHKIQAQFSQAFEAGSGPKKVTLPLLQVPVSRIELKLKGSKQVSVQPTTFVSYERTDKETKASFNLPIAPEAHISWVETLAQDSVAELRAEAELYHSATVDQGLLKMLAIVDYQVKRGQTETIIIRLPKDIDISQVETQDSGTSARITDWRVEPQKDTPFDSLAISFDRPIQNQVRLLINYDRAFSTAENGQNLTIPLLQAQNAYHQRGMLALLASHDLALNPTEDSRLLRIGENQLPLTVRERFNKTITHTYRYQDTVPQLKVQVVAAEKKQAHFESQIASLYSLQDVSLRSQATIDINVKSGSLSELTLRLPSPTNILSLTAPSLRNYISETKDGVQLLKVQFTQELEGQFRLEMLTERLLKSTEEQLTLPIIQVQLAEIEQGKLGLEALSAIEVQVEHADGLTSLNVSELPQELLLKTSNPLLLAYKYVKAESASENSDSRLALKLIRHQSIELQNASIERAEYQSLVTIDGTVITRAYYLVRNSGRQFLRLQLPSEARIWSAEVNGIKEKPALIDAQSPMVLLRLINSEQPFAISVTYNTQTHALGMFGKLKIELPVVDLAISESNWELFTPSNAQILNLNSSFEQSLSEQKNPPQVSSKIMHLPLEGQRHQLKQLYSADSKQQAYAQIFYATGLGSLFGYVMMAVAALTLIFGLKTNSRLAYSMRAAGTLGMLFFAYGMHFDSLPALLLLIAALFSQSVTMRESALRLQ